MKHQLPNNEFIAKSIIITQELRQNIVQFPELKVEQDITRAGKIRFIYLTLHILVQQNCTSNGVTVHLKNTSEINWKLINNSELNYEKIFFSLFGKLFDCVERTFVR
jgi:hypothetical protein